MGEGNPLESGESGFFRRKYHPDWGNAGRRGPTYFWGVQEPGSGTEDFG